MIESIKVKRLPEFAKYFNPATWRHWRGYTYYRLFGCWFIVVYSPSKW